MIKSSSDIKIVYKKPTEYDNITNVSANSADNSADNSIDNSEIDSSLSIERNEQKDIKIMSIQKNKIEKFENNDTNSNHSNYIKKDDTELLDNFLKYKLLNNESEDINILLRNYIIENNINHEEQQNLIKELTILNNRNKNRQNEILNESSCKTEKIKNLMYEFDINTWLFVSIILIVLLFVIMIFIKKY